MFVQSITSTAEVVVVFIASHGAAAEAALTQTARVCFAGLCTSNLCFCLYGALACATFLQAWHAWTNCEYHRAREHGLAGLVNTIMAFLQLHG
jgi:hypothetical protein